MVFEGKNLFIISLLFASILLAITAVSAGATTLYQSVEQALSSNPQLQALNHNYQALEYDLKQAKSGYFPSVDLLLGYGAGQFSDDVTRQSGADPNDSDWNSRGDATLRLTQKLYDGGETGSEISIRKALLNSADYWTKATAQSVALDTITAHLDVFRQREIISLSEKNLQIHHDIYQSLAEREQAGAGSIADVTQAQARLARAESTLYLSQADLNRTIANYTQVVGTSPGKLAYAGDPETLPGNLASILQQMEQRNPELLAVAAEKAEATSRLSLARVNYKPKIDLELSSRYNDQLEGNQSWQNSNAAMLNLRWNLFNGGADRAGVSAARSRKSQSQSKYAAKLAELTEETATAWANYVSLQRQRTAYLDAVNFSRKTFDAYLKQFSVSQRSLLDVLSAENDYFQSAVQLISVDINTTLAAYQLLALSGNIQPSHCPEDVPEYYWELTQLLSMTRNSPEKVKTVQLPTTELSREQQVRKFIKLWVDAWQAQDAETYLHCYHGDFTPTDGRTHQQWQEQRMSRLAKATFIDVAISELKIFKKSDSEYQVTFIQDYSSNLFQDRVNKELLLESTMGHWVIFHELSQPIFESEDDLVIPREENTPAASIADLTNNITTPKTLKIGPCLNQAEVKRVKGILDSYKVNFQQSTGSGQVTVTRLLEGIYPASVARGRLIILKRKVPSAFVLPQGGQLGLYAGSFHEQERAEKFAKTLEQKQIKVEIVPAKVELNGKMLLTKQLDNNIATKISTELKNNNLPFILFE